MLYEFHTNFDFKIWIFFEIVYKRNSIIWFYRMHCECIMVNGTKKVIKLILFWAIGIGVVFNDNDHFQGNAILWIKSDSKSLNLMHFSIKIHKARV